MGQSALVQLLAIGTMAVCMLMLGTATLIFQNARDIADGWGVDVPMTVYMIEGTSEDETKALARRMRRLPEVTTVERITPNMALERLHQGLGEQSDVLEGIDADALPDTLEVYLDPELGPTFAPKLATRLLDFGPVEEVGVLGDWVQEAQSVLATLRNLALGVGLLVGLACMAIVWSTIRLGVFARRAELEILRLVGGTNAFVRGPFLVEGVLQGVLGTALALGTLWLAFDVLEPFLARGLSMVLAAGSLEFFTPLQLGLALGLGALIGALGARAAVARYVEV